MLHVTYMQRFESALFALFQLQRFFLGLYLTSVHNCQRRFYVTVQVMQPSQITPSPPLDRLFDQSG